MSIPDDPGLFCAVGFVVARKRRPRPCISLQPVDQGLRVSDNISAFCILPR